MGIASVVLGVLAMILAVAGALLTVIPFLGALLSFAAPVAALIGIVLGGVALSRAKEESGETGLPIAGLIVSIIAFFPAIFVALTCGVCNSMCSASSLAPRDPNATPYYLDDGGYSNVSPGITPPVPPPDPTAPPPDPTAPADPNAPPADPNAAVPQVDPNAPVPQVDPSAPPPAFPPPPGANP